jgi:hypothetical protein
VAVGETGRALVRCRTGCETDQVLAAVGLSFQDLLPAGGEAAYFRTAREAKVLREDEAAARDRAYRAILDRLELEPDHLAHLFGRGLDTRQVEAAGYKSIRAGTFLAACKAVNPSFDPAAYDGPVPGLRLAGKDTLWSGLLVPVRDPLGRVVALKVRRFAGEPRYCYVSDPEAPSGAPCHWPEVGHPDWRENTVRVTEGELKADVATLKSGTLTLSVPGVGNWKPLIDQVTRRFREGLFELTFVVAYDWWDVREKEGVRAQARALLNALAGLGAQVALEYWHHREYKGVDDLLAAGHTPDRVDGLENCLALLNALDPRPLGVACVKVVEEDDLPDPEDPCEFPVNVFPPRVRAFVENVSEATDAPVDFPGLATIVVGATALGAARRINIKPGWYESPIFYSAVIAPPGASKSPAINRVQRPMVARQAELLAQHDQEVAAWRANDGEKKKTPRPVARELFTSDPTVAALTALLAANPKGVLLSMDEILGWVRSFNQFNQGGNDQQFYLTLWNGQSLKVNRKTGDNPITFVKYPYASVLGGIQPTRLNELAEGGRNEDGFLSRFLLSYPEVGPLAYWEESDFDGHQEEEVLASGWAQVYDRLVGVPLSGGNPGVVYLAPETRAQTVRWYNERIVDRMRDPAFPSYLTGFFLKLRAYYFRFALTLEYLWWAEQGQGDPPITVSRRSLTLAAALCDYFVCHAYRVAGYSNPSEEFAQVEELVRWCWGGRKNGRVSARAICTSNNPRLPTRMTEARELMIIAQQYGKGTHHSELDGTKDVFVASKPEGK